MLGSPLLFRGASRTGSPLGGMGGSSGSSRSIGPNASKADNGDSRPSATRACRSWAGSFSTVIPTRFSVPQDDRPTNPNRTKFLTSTEAMRADGTADANSTRRWKPVMAKARPTMAANQIG